MPHHVAVILAANDLKTVMGNMTGWVTGIVAGIATVILTIGGLRYVLGSGDPGEVEKAKTAIRSAAIGYGIAILAPIFVGILRNWVGGP